MKDTASAANALVMDVCETTGLRVGDVLALTVEQLQEADDRRGWCSVEEDKTGKVRRVHLTVRQRRALNAIAGARYVFEGRLDPYKHRHRSTVYKAMKRGAKAGGLREAGVSPHSLRKVYAVELYRRNGGDLAAVQRALNHDRESTTVLYAMADKIGASHSRRRTGIKSKTGAERPPRAERGKAQPATGETDTGARADGARRRAGKHTEPSPTRRPSKAAERATSTFDGAATLTLTVARESEREPRKC